MARLWILTHDNADFDAVASQLAAYLLDREGVPVLSPQLNDNVRRFLALYGAALPFRRREEVRGETPERILLVDTQTPPSLGWLKAPPAELPPLTILDHHPLQVPLRPQDRYEGGERGANTTLLVERLAARRIPLSPIQATLLLLGIYEDTGGLLHAGTTPHDLQAAAWLLEQGARLEEAARHLRHPLSPEQQRAYRALLEAARIWEIQGVQILVAPVRLKEHVPELSTLAHLLWELYDPDALFLIVQLNGHVQVIARSRVPEVDAGEVARELGGGGHAFAAAAFRPERTVEETVEELERILWARIRPVLRAHQIMTRRLHTVGPDQTLAEAAELLTRYGHSSLPVVDGEGRLVGLITRKAVDRAVNHGLGEKPVRAYMWRRPEVIGPETPLSEIRRRMAEKDLGRLPVVDEEGRLLGLITRSDLLRAWPPVPARPTPPGPNLADRLEEALPPALLRRLRELSELAQEMGFGLYLVGGFVRDLLLGHPTLDLDLVVEGDAIALAHALAPRWGAQVRSHRRFGTAKLLLPPELARELGLPHLDLATARTEIYERPTALPVVEYASLQSDLYRRDFTVNAMAVALNPREYGRLIDPFGGERDLRRRLLRILHNLSFVDDPTRILRAARLEARLDFRVEPRTLEILRDALGDRLLARTSPTRVWQELELILQEPTAVQALERLAGWDALTQVGLVWEGRLAAALEAAGRLPGDLPFPVRTILLFAPLPEGAARERLAAFRPRRQVRRQVEAFLQLRRESGRILGAPSPGAAALRLRPYPEPVLWAWALWEGGKAEALVRRYLEAWRDLRTQITGDDLRRMGLKPGPLYRRLLDALWVARADGEVRTREEEEAYLARLLTVEGLARLLEGREG